jgi:hypothetical protein
VQSRSVGFDQEGADRILGRSITLSASKDHQAIRGVGVDYESRLPVEQIGVTLARGRDLDCGRVIDADHISQSPGADLFTLGELWQELFALGVASAVQDLSCAEHVVRAEQIGRGRVTSREFFAHDCHRPQIKPLTALVGGDHPAGQPGFGQCLSMIGGELAFTIPLEGAGGQLLCGEWAHVISQSNLFITEIELHAGALLRQDSHHFQFTGDDGALDFAGALVNPRDANVAVQLLDQ